VKDVFSPLDTLLVGPPGTGKTMTASVIASELKIPLYSVQMDRIITKYLGETGSKLRQLFDFIETQNAIFFFDEFDTIGSDRSNENEVGEMKRALNSLLQFIDASQSESLIIAATNNVGLLDKALFRHFDDIFHY
jgi:SpoVK/Ycf46/Vps4 family AAA+-type ATPase